MVGIDVARTVLVVVHLMGMAALVGGYILQLRAERIVVGPLLVGGIVQVVSGIALIATRKAAGLAVIDEKMVVKLAVVLAVLAAVLALRARQRRQRPARGWFHTAGVLAIADVVIAVAWT